jgi:hypothetical protein
MEYIIVYYPNKQKPEDKGHYFFSLFKINFNTKYLVVSWNYIKNAKHVIEVLKYIKHHFYIEHVRGDCDRIFVVKRTYKYLNYDSIRYYFTKLNILIVKEWLIVL